MAEARLCRGCKRWHDTLLDCKRAARMGQAWGAKPTSTAPIVAQERPQPARVVCHDCKGKELEIAGLRARVEELQAELLESNRLLTVSNKSNKPARQSNKLESNSAKKSNKSAFDKAAYQRDYMARKRAEKKAAT